MVSVSFLCSSQETHSQLQNLKSLLVQHLWPLHGKQSRFQQRFTTLTVRLGARRWECAKCSHRFPKACQQYVDVYNYYLSNWRLLRLSALPQLGLDAINSLWDSPVLHTWLSWHIQHDPNLRFVLHSQKIHITCDGAVKTCSFYCSDVIAWDQPLTNACEWIRWFTTRCCQEFSITWFRPTPPGTVLQSKTSQVVLFQSKLTKRNWKWSRLLCFRSNSGVQTRAASREHSTVGRVGWLPTIDKRLWHFWLPLKTKWLSCVFGLARRSKVIGRLWQPEGVGTLQEQEETLSSASVQLDTGNKSGMDPHHGAQKAATADWRTKFGTLASELLATPLETTAELEILRECAK